ncbi:hypothetical protein ACFLY7_01560 [Patescibacteria group bacterium]
MNSNNKGLTEIQLANLYGGKKIEEFIKQTKKILKENRDATGKVIVILKEKFRNIVATLHRLEFIKKVIDKIKNIHLKEFINWSFSGKMNGNVPKKWILPETG